MVLPSRGVPSIPVAGHGATHQGGAQLPQPISTGTPSPVTQPQQCFCPASRFLSFLHRELQQRCTDPANEPARHRGPPQGPSGTPTLGMPQQHHPYGEGRGRANPRTSPGRSTDKRRKHVRHNGSPPAPTPCPPISQWRPPVGRGAWQRASTQPHCGTVALNPGDSNLQGPGRRRASMARGVCWRGCRMPVVPQKC